MKRTSHSARPLSFLIILFCIFSLFLIPGCKKDTDRKKNLLETTLIAAHELDEGYDYNIENLRLTKVEVTDPKVIVGHTCKMKITIESSEPRIARDVPVSFYLLNNNDLKSENGEVRQIYMGSPAIDKVKPGVNTYNIEIVIPQVNDQNGSYTLFSVFHDYAKYLELDQESGGAAQKMDDTGENPNVKLFLEKKVTTDVIVTGEYINSCDLYMPELIIQDDVLVFSTGEGRQKSNTLTETINGTLKATANAAGARGVKINFYIKTPDGAINERLPVLNQSDQTQYSLDIDALEAYKPVDLGFVLGLTPELKLKMMNHITGLGKKSLSFTISAEMEGASEAPMMNLNNIKTGEVQVVIDNPREAEKNLSRRLQTPLHFIKDGFAQTLYAASAEDKTRHDWWGPLSKDPHAGYNTGGKEWFGIGFHFDTCGYNIFDKSDISRTMVNIEANANLPVVLFTKEFKIVSAETYIHYALADPLGLHAMEDEFHKKGEDGTVKSGDSMKYMKDKINGFSVRLCVLNDKEVFKYQITPTNNPKFKFEWKTNDLKDIDTILRDSCTYKSKNADFSKGQAYVEESGFTHHEKLSNPFAAPPFGPQPKDTSTKNLCFYSEVSYTVRAFVVIAPVSLRFGGFFSFGIGAFAKVQNNVSIGIIPYIKLGCKVEGLLGGTFLGGGVAVTVELLKLENRNMGWCDFDLQSRNDPDNKDKKVKMRFNFAFHSDLVLWGPKGDIKLVAYYKFIKFCKKWKIPYPCGLEQKKSEFPVYTFPFSKDPLWSHVFIHKEHLFNIPLE